MDYFRRDLGLLLPAILSGLAAAQSKGGVLPSKCYLYGDLEAKTDPENHHVTRPVFQGETHTGVPIEAHITTLAPGQAPHAPHRHVHEELLFIHEGQVEMSIEGKTTKLGAGSVGYVRSNDLHGVRNTGDKPAQYFVFAMGMEKS